MQDFFMPFDRATKVEVSSSFRINNLMTNLYRLNGAGMTFEIHEDTKTVQLFTTKYNTVKNADKSVTRTELRGMSYVIKLSHLSETQLSSVYNMSIAPTVIITH